MKKPGAAGTPVRLPGWLFFASDLLILTAFVAKGVPLRKRAKRKEPQEEGLGPSS